MFLVRLSAARTVNTLNHYTLPSVNVVGFRGELGGSVDKCNSLSIASINNL